MHDDPSPDNAQVLLQAATAADRAALGQQAGRDQGPSTRSVHLACPPHLNPVQIDPMLSEEGSYRLSGNTWYGNDPDLIHESACKSFIIGA